MLEASITMLLMNLILSEAAGIIALIFCASLPDWSDENKRKGELGLVLGSVAMAIYLISAIVFSIADVIEYADFIMSCLSISIVSFCSYVIISVTMVRHKYGNYILSLLQSDEDKVGAK